MYSHKYFLVKFKDFNDIPNTEKDWRPIWEDVAFTSYCTDTEASELREKCKYFQRLR